MSPESAARQRILVAGTVDAVQTARLIIGEDFDYRCAFSLEQAQAELHPGLRAVLCNMRFEDARMLDFLEALRGDERGASLPLVCFHAHGWEVSSSAQEAMQTLLDGFPNARFVDLYAIARSDGVSAAAAALREAVSSAVGVS
jgi:hypothetical protein